MPEALTALQRLSPVGKILVDAIAVHNHRSWVAGDARHGRGRSGSAIRARPGKARGGGLQPPEAFAGGAQNLRGAIAGAAFRNRDLVELVGVCGQMRERPPSRAVCNDQSINAIASRVFAPHSVRSARR